MNTHKPQKYRTSNWSSYNLLLKSRGSLDVWFDPDMQWFGQPTGKLGRYQTFSDAAIQVCLMIKSLFQLPLRQTTGFVESLLRLCELTWTTPDFSTLSRRQKHINIDIPYQASRNGLHLLVDSTGIKMIGECEWKRKKHGAEYRRKWRGCHRRSLVEGKMRCVKLLGEKLMSRDFDRQVNELHARIAVLNHFTMLGRPCTQVVS